MIPREISLTHRFVIACGAAACLTFGWACSPEGTGTIKTPDPVKAAPSAAPDPAEPRAVGGKAVKGAPEYGPERMKGIRN